MNKKQISKDSIIDQILSKQKTLAGTKIKIERTSEGRRAHCILKMKEKFEANFLLGNKWGAYECEAEEPRGTGRNEVRTTCDHF